MIKRAVWRVLVVTWWGVSIWGAVVAGVSWRGG